MAIYRSNIEKNRIQIQTNHTTRSRLLHVRNWLIELLYHMVPSYSVHIAKQRTNARLSLLFYSIVLCVHTAHITHIEKYESKIDNKPHTHTHTERLKNWLKMCVMWWEGDGDGGTHGTWWMNRKKYLIKWKWQIIDYTFCCTTYRRHSFERTACYCKSQTIHFNWIDDHRYHHW